MIRALWLLTDLAGGGAERLPLVLAPALRGSRMDLALLKDQRAHALPADAPPVIPLSPSGTRLSRAFAPILGRLVQAARAHDVVIAGMEWAPSLFGVTAGALARRPVIAVVHPHLRGFYGDANVPAAGWRALAGALRAARAVVAVSPDARDGVLELGVPAARVRVIPNPVPRGTLERPARGARPRLLTVARLHPVKGLDVVLAAAARLADLDFEWIVLGEGPERAALEAEARRLGVHDKVRFPGFDPDTAPHYAAADVFVLASHLEGMPLVVLEAMSAGLPIVATRCGRGVEETLAHGLSALLVPPGDAGALAAAVRDALGDPALRRRLAAGAAAAAGRFDLDAVAAQWDALIAEVAHRAA